MPFCGFLDCRGVPHGTQSIRSAAHPRGHLASRLLTSGVRRDVRRPADLTRPPGAVGILPALCGTTPSRRSVAACADRAAVHVRIPEYTASSAPPTPAPLGRSTHADATVSEFDSLSPLQQQALERSCAQSNVPIQLADPRTIEQVTALLRSPATSPMATETDVHVRRRPNDAGSSDGGSGRTGRAAPRSSSLAGDQIQSQSDVAMKDAQPWASTAPPRYTDQDIVSPSLVDEPAA